MLISINVFAFYSLAQPVLLRLSLVSSPALSRFILFAHAVAHQKSICKIYHLVCMHIINHTITNRTVTTFSAHIQNPILPTITFDKIYTHTFKADAYFSVRNLLQTNHEKHRWTNRGNWYWFHFWCRHCLHLLKNPTEHDVTAISMQMCIS